MSKLKFIERVVTPKQMKLLEATADRSGTSYEDLMLNAGERLANTIEDSSKILFLCGNGNNAGDCFVASRILSEGACKDVTIGMLCGEPKTELSKKMFSLIPKSVRILYDLEDIKHAFKYSNVVCDGIFGTGFHGEIPESIQDLLSNETNAFKVAVDIPSGIDCKTGEVSNGTMSADVTLTFAYEKLGMVLYPADKYCGKVVVADIGITEEHYRECISTPIEVLSKDNVQLPKRIEKGHKGTFGRLLHVTGSRNMLGACIMASKSALRCGIGLLTICTESSDILPLAMCEPIYIPRNYDDISKELKRTQAILIGCGLGTGNQSVGTFNHVVKNAQSPIVIDADAINILSKNMNVIKDKDVVLTPHVAEFSRLTGKSVEEIQRNRLAISLEFAKKYRCTLILKGSGDTIITDGKSAYICNVANSGMGKGGSGDVLAGMISSFIAQGLSLIDACKLAVYVHSQAGLNCAKRLGKYSMLPTDVIEEIPNVIKSL